MDKRLKMQCMRMHLCRYQHADITALTLLPEFFRAGIDTRLTCLTRSVREIASAGLLVDTRRELIECNRAHTLPRRWGFFVPPSASKIARNAST